MAVLRFAQRGKSLSPDKRITEENILEKNIDDQIASDPDLLGEPLLLIGRKLIIQDPENRLDFLALDKRGNAVLIELKKSLGDDALDITSLKDASYISLWKLEEFEKQAKRFLGKMADQNFSLSALFQSFCTENGVRNIPQINKEQRLMIIGSLINDKLTRYAKWLKDHHIDITVVELQAFRDEDNIIIKPEFIIRSQKEDAAEKEAGLEQTQPVEGATDTQWKTWHLEKRCSPKTKEMCLKLDKILNQHFELDGPHWEQKSYISYKIHGTEWLCIATTPSILRLDFLVKPGSLNVEDIAKTLKISKFEGEESIEGDLESISSVFIKNRDENFDQVQIRIKEGFNVESDPFILFLEEANRAFLM